MAVNNNYPFPKRPIEITEDFLRWTVSVIENCVNGKTNNTGEFTVTASATSTTVNNILCNDNSVILLSPITANAGAEAAGGDVYVEAGDKEFTVYHASDTSEDRTFRYVIVG